VAEAPESSSANRPKWSSAAVWRHGNLVVFCPRVTMVLLLGVARMVSGPGDCPADGD
jgi:hypothetical protein